ncbi:MULTISPECIES: AAA family ATPase [Streptomyces]|uniref:AAA family ATPase n=1 Tax=Streptomyces parvus TaxID=66428 RepID=A0A5D4JPI6_9ACTN|nr:AAA family ATPase [Streptomyces parvus]TYR66165.1 AAA family ATPase [Streptomyces parvus]
MTTSYDPTSALPPDDVLTAGLADLPPLDWADGPPEQPGPARKLRLTRASDIEPEPVVWAWLDEGEGRIPAGALSVAAGREGTGKSSFGMWMAAQITRGALSGNFYGRPRAVFYVAVEDSWKQTIVPRLIGAGADLDLVYRVEAVEAEFGETTLSLPQDNSLMEQAIRDHDVALVVLDPLMSCIGKGIDTHRERDVRTALDPLARMADRTGCVLLGIAHFGKGAGTDPSALITGSGAFKNVPRAVFGFARDDDNDCRVMSQSKNSLGRADLPSLSYNIETTEVPTKKGLAYVGRFTFTGESTRSVSEILAQGQEGDRGERDEAGAWLVDYLTDNGGEASAGDVIKAAEKDGFAKHTIQRARSKVGVTSQKSGFGKGWVWVLSVTDTDEGDTKVTKMTPNPTSESSSSSSPSGSPSASESQNVTDIEALCTVCGGPLDPVHATTGDTTHPTC